MHICIYILVLSSVAQCENCTAGYYCGQPGLNVTSGVCQHGYYCPPGSKDQQEVTCPPGGYCPTGSREPLLCKAGTFQPNTERWNEMQCQNCTEGMM